MMKQCPNCGSSAEEKAMVCNNCGVSFSGDGNRGGRQSQQGQNRQSPGQKQQSRQGQNRQPRQEQHRQPRQGQVGQGQQAAGAQSGTSQTLSDRIASLGITRVATLAAGILLLIAAFLPWVTAVTGGQLSANATETEFGTPVLIAGGAVLGCSAVRWGRGFGWITMLLSGVAGAGAVYISVAAQQVLSATQTAPFQAVIVRGSRVPIGAVEPGVGVVVTIAAGSLAVVGSLFGIIGSFTDY
jgi:hypothetical protein